MNTTSEAWGGSSIYQCSYRSRISLHAEDAGGEGFRWCLTEAWKLGEYPEDVKTRKRIHVWGRANSMDAAKAAAEQMSARILKVRRSYR